MALYLRKHGIPNVYPLAGGFDDWVDAGFSIVRVADE